MAAVMPESIVFELCMQKTTLTWPNQSKQYSVIYLTGTAHSL